MKIYAHSDNFPIDIKTNEILSAQQKVGNFSPAHPFFLGGLGLHIGNVEKPTGSFFALLT